MMRRLAITVLVALAGLPAVAVWGGEPVRVTLWAAEVPVARIPEWQGKGEGGWFAAARADVAAGRSEEAAMLLVSGRQGERMRIESVREVIQEYGQDDGGTWKLSFPRFVTREIRSSLECVPGRWTLAGMVDPWRAEAKPGTKVLLFVRVETMQRAK